MRKYFIGLLFLMVTASVGAQNKFEKLDAWLAANTSQMGGRAILLIYKDGHIIYSGVKNEMNSTQKMFAQMVANRTGKSANTADFTPTTREPIASCSKWLSAALVMTFVDEGKLKLSDTVGKYLPILSKGGKGNITISQCLSHTTAIKAPSLSADLSEMRKFQSMDDAMYAIANLPMEGKPGTVFRYSNAGLQIAAAVIEKISGKSFEDLFAERVARPLAMKNTDFGHGKVAFPAGGGNSTPEDYTNFLVMIMNRGIFNDKRILSEKSISEMQIDRIVPGVTVAYSPAEAGEAAYGYGEWVAKGASLGNPSQSVTSPGLFGSFPLVDNQNKYTAFLMTYYIKNTGRAERYKQLKQLIDEAVK